MNHTIRIGGGRKDLKLKAFTLAEVLITLVIIGVVAAMTVPIINQSSQEKEYAAKLKKNYSVLQNAIKRAQIDEGMMGDNEALFTTGETLGSSLSSLLLSYKTVERMSKYMNAQKLCRYNSKECKDIYDKYKIQYANSSKIDNHQPNYSLIVLADGTYMWVYQEKNCDETSTITVRDEYDEVVYKSDGVTPETTDFHRTYCAVVLIDVNGDKKPNKYGKDVYYFGIYRNKIEMSGSKLYGGKNKTLGKLFDAQYDE